MKLENKIVLVAGSGRGTGREIALQAARAGADVITCARSLENAQSVAKEITAMGRSAEGFAADLSKVQDIQELVKKSLEVFGRIDMLIYNAALERPMRFTKISETDWNQMLDTNLKGYFFTAQVLTQYWQSEKRPGTIVAIASTAGLVGYPFNSDYCASKGGMIALTKALAIDLGPSGIRANAVAPGHIDSEIIENNRKTEIAGKTIEAYEKFTPLQRFAQMEDVAKAAIYLASDDSSYTTGAVLTVDGGITLGNLPTPNTQSSKSH